MSNKTASLILVLMVTAHATPTAFAEKALLSAKALDAEADAVVVATIEKIRIESESSMFEPGFGNTDWGIYLTLDIDSVEKGDVAEGSLEARCFRIKTRRSVRGYVSPSGHYPIPEVGTRVRVYLEGAAGSWDVVLPNGISAVAEGGQASRTLSDAEEVTQLRSMTYAFIIPLELWILAALLVFPLLGFFGWRSRRGNRASLSTKTDTLS